MVVDRRGARRRAALSCAVVVVAFACADEPEPIADPIDPGPQLYVAVASSEPERLNPTQLTIFDLGDPLAPRAATILDSGPAGRVGVVRQTSSPSGRYAIANRVLDVERYEPWFSELYLVDFEVDPLAAPKQLSLQQRYVTVGWAEDESMMWLVTYDLGQSLWTVHVDDGDPGPPAHIPIELPFEHTQIGEPRWAGAERLYVFASDGVSEQRLFAAELEDRWPVEVKELALPGQAGDHELIWAGTDTRALVGGHAECQLASYDRDVQAASVVALPRDAGPCSTWLIVEDDDGEPAWLGYTETLADGDRLLWVPLAWGPGGVEVGPVTEVDARNHSRPSLARDRAYFLNWSADDGHYRLMDARVGTREAEVVVSPPEGTSGISFRFNRDRTRLIVDTEVGVLSFALGDDGPGPAILASPVGGVPWTWSLHHHRFVQVLQLTLDSAHVRLVDLGEPPPRVVDLLAVLPLYAIPSPIDARVFVLDNFELFVNDPQAPDLRLRLGEPNAAFVHDFTVHAPGFGAYE